MGLAALSRICVARHAEGLPDDTPVAVVSRATLSDQQVCAGDLRTIAGRARDLPGPATIVVGATAALARGVRLPEREAAWYDRRDGRPRAATG